MPSTTETTLDLLPAELRDALLERIESALLTVPADARAFLTQDEHDVAFVIGPRDLLVAVGEERGGASVLLARLEDLELGSLTELLRARGLDVPDEGGVDVTGFAASGPDGGRATYHIGLGPPAGDEARAALEQAIRSARA
jgi:hypothetical protein